MEIRFFSAIDAASMYANKALTNDLKQALDVQQYEGRVGIRVCV